MMISVKTGTLLLGSQIHSEQIICSLFDCRIFILCQTALEYQCCTKIEFGDFNLERNTAFDKVPLCYT